MSEPFYPVHPSGEDAQAQSCPENQSAIIDSFSGQVHINWDSKGSLTPLGQLGFFIEFLKISGLFDKLVEECPLSYSSNNAPEVRDVLGSLVLSILSGHSRYSHLSSLRYERVNCELLGMSGIVGSDSARRALQSLEETTALNWLSDSLRYCYEGLLNAPWILDIDATVKTIYGKQQLGEVGYNPHKPGRPSHVYHSYFISNIRMVLDVDLHPGKEVAGCYSMSALWSLLAALPKHQWPAFIRGDISYGNENIIQQAEAQDVNYLFKLKCSKHVKSLIAEKMLDDDEWYYAGQGYQGVSTELRLPSWSRARRVVILRRYLGNKDIGVLHKNRLSGQLSFEFADIDSHLAAYEYAVLVTSLQDDVLAIAQHYRDRADSENNFDELKNQWGWCGYTTHDAKRCKIMAKLIALVYDWWNIFVRLVDPTAHREAQTSRPLLLQAVGQLTHHARKRHLTIFNTHAKAEQTKSILLKITAFFQSLKANAQQLTPKQCLSQILKHAFRQFAIHSHLPPPEQNLLPA